MQNIPSRQTLFSRWERRSNRLGRRLRIRAGDLRNDLSWYIGGGRRRFGACWRELAEAHRWVFVIGCNNSGTSLLQRLLDRTGQVSTFPAEGQLYTRALARDRNRAHARVWTEYLDQLQLRRGQSMEQAPRLVHDWMLNLPRPIRPVIVEKTPVNTARAQWLQDVFPNACFIGLVRNGYAVTEGIRRKAGQPVAAGARHWSAVNRLMLDAARGLDRYLEVRYEDLADRPIETMRPVCALAGLDVATLAGGGTAMTTASGPIRNRDTESLARLTARDFDAIDREAGAMLDHFGYRPAVPARQG